MRNLSANALAQIAATHGNEPITIVEIDWIADEGSKLYADRTVGSIEGKILEVGDLDNIISVSDNDSSQELALTLDDTDGTIKAILDTHDIHKRSARVYQWFDGMALADRFLLFAGKISSPITWNERNRTVAFSIISQLEDKEVGFSAEEGEFPWIPKDIIDKAWPMIFGKVQDVPAMQFNQAVKGSTLCGVGIISGNSFNEAFPLGGNDVSYSIQMAAIGAQIDHLGSVYAAYDRKRHEIKDAAEKSDAARGQQADLRDQRNQMSFQHWKNGVCAEFSKAKSVSNPNDLGCNPVTILGGEDFPQNIGMTIRIGQGLFTGYFEGDKFYISDRLHEEHEEKAEGIYDGYVNQGSFTRGYRKAKLGISGIPGSNPFLEGGTDVDIAEWCNPTETPTMRGGYWEYKTMVGNTEITTRKAIFVPAGTDLSGGRPSQISQHYWAEAGTTVDIASSEPVTYVASIVPGTVLDVKAYKVFENERKLINIPSDLYVIQVTDYGPIQAVEIVFDKPLSTITGQGWNDDIYVTFESDIGPHTCDILEYIITNFTDLDFDATSFTNIRTSLDPFPMNFPILEKKNAITVLQEIAFQARCALWISNGTFYIKYLPVEPSSDDTITESDIDAESGIEISLTPTEDLVTKMVVEWRISWNEDDPNKVILRHNVKKYGTQSEDYFFYCFNQPDIVLKAATFWLIRKANTWKKMKFKTYLQKLNLETFDTVLLDFNSAYVSTGDVKAIVEEANYNSADQTIDFVCHTPVRSGEMIEYEFFWPSALSVDRTYPTAEDIAAGYAGGDGIGAGATGDLPIGFTDPDDWGTGVVWVGGPNVVFSGPADHGEHIPTDVDFEAQPVIFPTQYAELDVSANPDPDLTQRYKTDMEIEPLAEIQHEEPGIDIRKTPIYDSDNGDSGPIATLDTFFKSIKEDAGDAKLVVDCDESKWGDSEHEDGEEFHFKYDDDGERFGAGTAFLAEDSD
jgi:hypothetical protein